MCELLSNAMAAVLAVSPTNVNQTYQSDARDTRSHSTGNVQVYVPVSGGR